MVSIQSKVRKMSASADRGSVALLYLNGVCVGEVHVKGFSAGWGYGDFAPAAAFSAFAPAFGQWSLLMHAQADAERPDRATAEELRQAERLLDAIRGQLYFPRSDEWIAAPELAISRGMVEWREY
jgi:hypothetical protein